MQAARKCVNAFIFSSRVSGTLISKRFTKKENSMEDTRKIKEAAEEWVRSFDRIPQNIILKLYMSGDNIIEITPPVTEARDTLLPMWGSMWTFSDSADCWWLEDEKHLQAMADCGFRIYEQEDFGYFFGIDGMGYDFYDAHWIPLYKARGLKWHCN
ncbi:MAG: hypothetical protein LBS36_09705 [Oscillospiraceae bacterium]|jgi:hypothetical protein|nr:hypothetical protein [Oscillospiraceae bacterium]